MKIRVILLSCIIALITWNQCLAADRALVSVIYSSDIEPYQQAWYGFKAYFDGKKTALWSTKYVLKEQTPEIIVAKIKAEKPDLIYALGTRAANLAQESLRNFPVVYALVLNPEKMEGDNITGVLLDIPAMTELESIQRIFPEIRKIGAIYSPESTVRVEEISQACKELGLQLIKKKIDDERQLTAALSDLTWQINCLLMIPDTKIYFPQTVKYLLLESLRQKFPVIGLSKLHTKAGALLSIDCDYNDLGRQAGELAVRIINGEKPSSLTPLHPRKINYSLNLNTASRLGINFSPQVIKGTEEIFGETEK